jgi:hypothetical protein
MGVAAGDFDGNGFLDIAKTNFSGDLPSLYLNGDGRFFTDIAREAGLGANQLLGWGVAFIDADEDGRPDLVLANGHVYPEVDKAAVGDRYLQKTLLYRNAGGGKFVDITGSAGPAFQVLRPSRGLATGDLDGDGRPEIVLVNMNGVPSVLRNSEPGRSRVVVELKGTKSNRSAIGARVTMEAAGLRQTQEVISGGSYYSQNDLRLHFGIGDATQIDRITVKWLGGGTQTWKKISANRLVRISEGQDALDSAPFGRGSDTAF